MQVHYRRWFFRGALALVNGILALAFIYSTTAQDIGGRAVLPPAGTEVKVLLFDGFEGKFGLNWSPIRPDPTHVSLKTIAGKLTIRTQRGTIHRDAKAQGWDEAKNLFVIDNPMAKDADFVVTTCVHQFMPIAVFQQAGLLLYGDDDNYVKWCVQFNRGTGVGQVFSLLSETDAVSEFRHYPVPNTAVDVWLRLTKNGRTYAAAASLDGKEFDVLEQREWGSEGPRKIGLIAKNGGGLEVAPEMDASFEFFELRAPVEEKAQP
jgi:regulation of enolase protein 1 (concanavalin A-like superfamily)